MSEVILCKVLGASIIINLIILFFWFLVVTFAREFIYKLHSRWFKISEETFNAIHYAGISFFKIIIIFFNVVPYLVLLFLK